jgi:acetyl esterase/lipase
MSTTDRPSVLTKRRLAAAIGAAGCLSACTPLDALNTLDALIPGGDARRLADGAAYGTHPRQKLDLYAPARSGDLAPVLVFFYGGGWSSGRRQDYRFAAEAFATRGFVVAVPDYRLVPDVRFPAFVQDGAAAVRWVRDRAGAYGGDPSRLALAGHSAGAYIAAMLALDPRWLAATGLPSQAVRAWAGLAGPYDFYPFDVPASVQAFGAYSDPQATQPINFVRPQAPATFLAAGTEDRTVKPTNSIALANALRQAGDTFQLRLYPMLDHVDLLIALSKPFRDKAPVLADTCAFLIDHCGPV